MKRWMGRLRGAIGMGLTWAAAWAPVGAITGWVTGLVLGFPLGVVTANYATLFAVLGFTGGALFSGVLTLAEGRRRFDELSLPRFVGWGAAGGLVLGGLAVALGLLGSGFSTMGAVVAGVCTLMGAAAAAGTLALARTADDQSLLTEGQDVAEVGLSAEDVRQLLGTGRSG